MLSGDKAIRIGIIDSGIVSSEHINIATQRDFSGSQDTGDILGHGSAVAAAIAGAGINILNAKVFDSKLVTSANTIVAALRWLIEQEADLINMSFGLRHDRPALRLACEQALAKNIVLVAAAPAQGAPVYPSNYTGIIRATGDARCKPDEISWLNSAQADFGGCSGSPSRQPSGASIGCAWVTRAISRLMQSQADLSGVNLLSQLTTNANYHGTEKVVARG